MGFPLHIHDCVIKLGIIEQWKKKRCYSSYLEDDDHVTVMLLHAFSICSTVLICANSYENTLSAKEIVEAKWCCRIFNLDRSILFCPLLTFYTPTSLYMLILHTFLQVLTRRICSTIRNFFFVIISSILMTLFIVQITEHLLCLVFLLTFRCW